MAKPLPPARIDTTSGGNGLTVSVPVLDAVLERVLREITVERGFAIYKKAIMAAGRIGLKEVKNELKAMYGKRKKKDVVNQAGPYGKTGALYHAMRMAFRTANSNLFSYAVIGADRDFQVATRRGKQAAYARPANYVHLVNRGFQAVARIPGISGRQTHYSVVRALRAIARRKKIERANLLSLKRLLEEGMDVDFRGDMVGDSRFGRKSAYLYLYRGSRKTIVQGRRFLEKAAARAQWPAVQRGMQVLQEEFDRALRDMEGQS
jgi:hypothetical protein